MLLLCHYYRVGAYRKSMSYKCGPLVGRPMIPGCPKAFTNRLQIQSSDGRLEPAAHPVLEM